MVYRISLLTLIIFTVVYAGAQPKVVDEVVAVVGDNYILRSDIEKEYETLKEQMGKEYVHDSMRIDILNDLISKKLLLYKAQLDSVEISDELVDAKMEERLNYILGHFGGDEKKLEAYLGTTVPEFKEKTREKLREQLLIQEMQRQIISEVKVSPAEVRNFFNDLSKDSLAPVSAEVEVAQIIMTPKVTAEAKRYAYEEAVSIRNRLLDGGDFCFLAQAYSDDPSSSGKCGELGYFKRGKMVAEFEAAAFRLEKDSFSKVIESEYGYHILQLLDRRGESVNVRHILISPMLLNSDLTTAVAKLDSLREQILAGTLTFEEVARNYSEDENTSGKGGLLMDYTTGETKIPVSNLDKDVFLHIKDLKPGEMTRVLTIVGPDGKENYLVYKLVSETPPHVPTLETDYLKIQSAALEKKKATALEDWVTKSKGIYYIHINDRFSGEPELAHWIKK